MFAAALAASLLLAAGTVWTGRCTLAQNRATLREAADHGQQPGHRRQAAVGALGMEVLLDVSILQSLAERDDELGEHARAMLAQVHAASATD